MNVGKSINKAIVDQGKDTKWLSEQLKVSVTRAGVLRNSLNTSTDTLQRLAAAFKMPVSEFIALGE